MKAYIFLGILALALAGCTQAEQSVKAPAVVTINQPEPAAANVAAHDNTGDCWVILDGQVYDVTDFLATHESGRQELSQNCGRDITAKYYMPNALGNLSNSAELLRDARLVS